MALHSTDHPLGLPTVLPENELRILVLWVTVLIT